ncbi:MAG TPA: LLM class flavin-dependent oxidoreductase [Chloroflexota bacterium]|nr:LLM class flavin-dependent oxidoreductase [Chloroflexota bacterium]
MKFAIHLPAFGEYAEPRAVADLAREAERAGWDGLFLWDHVIFTPNFYPMTDPFIALAAAAVQTDRLRLGTLLTPLPRRRPWKVARETVALDRLSGGRFILGVGLGDPAQWDYGFFGEDEDARVRAEKLDEGLALLGGLWSGELVGHEGTHYRMHEVRFQPTPLQRPRIPVWVGGWYPNKPPMRRAARWDGVAPGHLERQLTPEEWREILTYIAQHRTSSEPFDAVHSGGQTTGTDRAGDAATVRPYGEAGVTWWLEDVSPWRFGLRWEDELTPARTRPIRERVLAGPPGSA